MATPSFSLKLYRSATRISMTTETRVAWSIRLLLLALSAQIMISLPAWLSGLRTFPLVPALPGLPLDFGAAGDAFLLGGMLLGIAWLLWQPLHRGAAGLLMATASLMVLEDISRLQPWLYLYLLVIAGVALLPGKASGHLRLNILQLMLVATWFWSGLMKLNPSFEQEFFPMLLRPFGLQAFAEAHGWLAWVGGAVELFAGVGVLFPRLRTAALCCALGLHGFILLALGPWGLSWNPVVWPWNLAFAGVALLAFAGRRERVNWRVLRQPVVAVLAVTLLAMPALNLLGAWDHFLSGSYYSGRLPDAVFYYDRADRPGVPVTARPYVLQVRGTSEDLIPLEFWALGELNLPGYPEIRVKKRIGAQLCGCMRYPAAAGLRITRKRAWASEQEVLVVRCADLQ